MDLAVLRELLPQVVQPSCALESLVGGEDDSDLEMEVGAAETASEADDDTDAVDDDSDDSGGRRGDGGNRWEEEGGR